MNNKKEKIWGLKCEVPSCRSSKRDSPYLKFFRFPKDVDIYCEWIKDISLTGLPKPKNAYVCSKHFSVSEGSIPTLFLNDLTSNPSVTVEISASTSSTSESDAEHIPVLFSGKTYSRLHQSALHFEDLSHYEPNYTEHHQNNETILPVCSSCLQPKKQLSYFVSQYYALKRENETLEKKLSMKASECKRKTYLKRRKKKKFQEVKKQMKTPISDVIDTIPDISLSSKIFAKMLLCKKQKNKIWSEYSRILAQNLFYVSPSAYNYIRTIFKFNYKIVIQIVIKILSQVK